MDALIASSVNNPLAKINIRHLASRPVPQLDRFDLLEALKNAAQDTKHEKAGVFRLAFETPLTWESWWVQRSVS